MTVIVLNSVLLTGSKKAVKTLSFRKSNILLSLTLVLFLLLSSLGNADVGNADSSSIITQTTDTDGDGLNDDLEDEIGTNKTNKFGDIDNDGLYDFEEYLDLYGTPDNTEDTPKYKYNDSTSYDSDNGPILDIYHYFNLSSNKTNYLRDQNFTEQNGGFTDYLLWNVIFTGHHSGGSFSGVVSYSNNIMRDVIFTGRYSGGSLSSVVSYSNNIMRDVIFTGHHSGGSSSNSLSYSDNTMTNVHFTGDRSGGSHDGDVSYNNNMMTNVNFTGEDSGGSYNGDVSYNNNTMTSISFTGERSGGSRSGSVSYNENTLTNVRFIGRDSGGSWLGDVSYTKNTISHILLSGNNACSSGNGTSIYTDNVVVNDSYDIDGNGLGDGYELFGSEVEGLNSFTFLVALGIFISFSLFLVVYRVRRRVL